MSTTDSASARSASHPARGRKASALCAGAWRVAWRLVLGKGRRALAGCGPSCVHADVDRPWGPRAPDRSECRACDPCRGRGLDPRHGGSERRGSRRPLVRRRGDRRRRGRTGRPHPPPRFPRCVAVAIRPVAFQPTSARDGRGAQGGGDQDVWPVWRDPRDAAASAERLRRNRCERRGLGREPAQASSNQDL